MFMVLIFRNAILNGLEIMKINNSMSNLGVMDSPFVSSQSNYLKKKKKLRVLGIGLFLLLSLLAIVFLSIWLKKRKMSSLKGMLESRVSVVLFLKFKRLRIISRTVEFMNIATEEAR